MALFVGIFSDQLLKGVYILFVNLVIQVVGCCFVKVFKGILDFWQVLAVAGMTVLPG